MLQSNLSSANHNKPSNGELAEMLTILSGLETSAVRPEGYGSERH